MLSTVVRPTRQSLREVLARHRTPQPGLTLAVLALDGAIYVATLAAILGSGLWAVQVGMAVVNALVIARLFVHGHDACHGSSFRQGWANQLAGRLAFLPSLTPFSTWELGHNMMHHGFTNLRGKDYVYAPLTKAEYDALPRWRRAVERAYRHPLGPGLCYSIEVWWKRLWFPSQANVETDRSAYFFDSLGTAIYAAALVGISTAIAMQTGQNPVWLSLLAVGLPLGIWKALMGFVTFQHHTHPAVTWYKDRKHWDPLASQVENTVHVEFPRPVGLLLGNIMEHTAHHVDVKIPMFRLPAAQRALEEQFPEKVPLQRWSWAEYADNCRRCQLYDYDKRRWLSFDGAPSTSGTSKRPSRE